MHLFAVQKCAKVWSGNWSLTRPGNAGGQMDLWVFEAIFGRHYLSKVGLKTNSLENFNILNQNFIPARPLIQHIADKLGLQRFLVAFF